MVSSGVIQSTFGWKQGDSPCYFFKGQEPGHDAGDRFYKAMKRPGKVVGKGTAGGVTSEQKYASSGQKGQH